MNIVIDSIGSDLRHKPEEFDSPRFANDYRLASFSQRMALTTVNAGYNRTWAYSFAKVFA